MAKQDVLDAINATVSSNNVKGITADSLNNVLTMIVENAGEGGGGSGSGEGMLRLIVPDCMEFGTVFIEEFGEFSPSVLSEMRSIIESEDPESAQLYEPLFVACEDAFTHNAEVYRIIKEKANNGESCSVLLDMTPILKVYFDMLMDIGGEGEYIDEYLLSFSQIATVAYTNIKYNPEFEDFAIESLGAMPFPVPMESESDSPFYPSNISLMINPDGSIIFEKLEPSSDYELYIAASGNTLDSFYRENYNLKIRNEGYGVLGKIVEISECDNRASLSIGRFMIHEVIEDVGFLFFNGCDLKMCTIDSEGNVSIVTIGSIAIQQNS